MNAHGVIREPIRRLGDVVSMQPTKPGWRYTTELNGLTIRYDYTPEIPPPRAHDHDDPNFSDPGQGEEIEWCFVWPGPKGEIEWGTDDAEIVEMVERHIRADYRERQTEGDE